MKRISLIFGLVFLITIIFNSNVEAACVPQTFKESKNYERLFLDKKWVTIGYSYGTQYRKCLKVGKKVVAVYGWKNVKTFVRTIPKEYYVKNGTYNYVRIYNTDKSNQRSKYHMYTDFSIRKKLTDKWQTIRLSKFYYTAKINDRY